MQKRLFEFLSVEMDERNFDLLNAQY